MTGKLSKVVTTASWRKKKSQQGVTLLELLLVMLLITFLLLIGLLFVPRYLKRARDDHRKSDLARMKIAFEDFIADYSVYPEASLVADCHSTALAPYLQEVYCDPYTDEPYVYIRTDDGLQYGLFANLETPEDAAIVAVGCSAGCGPDVDGNGTGDYNFGTTGGGYSITDMTVPPLIDDGIPDDAISPSCGSGNGAFCYANVCGACCPGSQFRCTSDNKWCVPDDTCQ